MHTFLKLTLVLFILLAHFIFLSACTNMVASSTRPSAAPLAEGASLEKEISASLGWQASGILLHSGEIIHIQFVSGEIHDGDAILRGPSGVGWACGETTCCEPMPEAQRDALIGRVGDHFFAIGDKNEITAPADGELQLRINDCDAGLFDNSGSLIVNISH